MVRKGDILICVRNGSSELIGKSCVLPALDNTTFGAFMSVLRGDKTGYISKVFASRIIQEQIKNRSSATINQITKKDFQSIRIYIPQLESEQKEIAETLTVFDTHIANLTDLIEKKKAIRTGILRELIDGKTTLDGNNIEWEEVKLGEVAFYRNERISTSKKYYISTENMNQSFSGISQYNGDETVNGIAFYENDTLIANIRPYLKKVWCAEFSGCCSADVLVLAATDRLVPKILYYSIANDYFIDYVMAGGVKGIKMPRGDKKYILQYQMKIPKNIQDQILVSEMLTSIDDEIHSLESERDKIIQIREGAMDNLLTGKVRLTD